MVKGVLFDLDGVITDSAEYHFRAWREVSANAGINIDRSFNTTIRGVGRMAALDLILRHGGKENAFTTEQKTAMAVEKNKRYRELIRQISPGDLLPGMSDLLTALRSSGVRIALGSASHSAFTIIERLGITSLFDYVADAADVDNPKPAPDIFLDACRGIFLRPDEVVGIEDSKVGIESLRAGGIYSIGIGVEGDTSVSSTKEVTFELIMSIDVHKKKIK
jgi:beta-phosphoglucomutase